jgi:membrane fusion protein (multidrug efflux system)
VQQAEARLRQAELNLSYTQVTAPEAGYVTHRTVEQGAYVDVGQSLLAIVPKQVWVVANFKETQLKHMRAGQPATVQVDAYPQSKFTGHVDSIQAGSGAKFSLFPPENATGNYVKVAQRVPVKIVFDEDPNTQLALGPGMSVVPTVRVKAIHPATKEANKLAARSGE